MKKSILSLVFLVLIFSLFMIVPAFSQKVDEADVYYVNVQILRIFTHSDGFYVIYRRAGLKHAEVFIPKSWLEPKDGRARMELVNTRVNPYLSFYIKDGKFDHIKIAAPRDLGNPVWGTLKAPNEYDSKFEGIETLELKF
ncbi:hypothetical protein [Treponema putidum]|uniref:Uncharacterized protein n=1 Tax=Treponema putidum TaxID=221027 RepID=A0AAE9MVL7_9SPIR|nr:hypothetical protein [Treponema putidum]AIN94699.1 hypothetical protein JO40_11915 [Treponema putidum]TWI77567.1 hypothetical protein JM98_01261 [Treponema putidum]UTY28715.1 hypothetical protein E4N76_06680 [Treponema putidum]UTY31145.1 hypothetical protein E4N75_06125 [Treponema putidum]UTY33582.1 hypothetical protein E4N74_05790 [Treponema putidum]